MTGNNKGQGYETNDSDVYHQLLANLAIEARAVSLRRLQQDCCAKDMGNDKPNPTNRVRHKRSFPNER